MNTIRVIGLGAAELNQLPLGIYRALIHAESPVYMRTKEHPVVHELEKEGLAFRSFDDVYESHQQFGDVYKEIVDMLVEASAEGDLLYVVPGHPMLAERTTQLLLEKREAGIIAVEILGDRVTWMLPFRHWKSIL